MILCPYTEDGCDFRTVDSGELDDHMVKWHGEEEEYDDEDGEKWW